MDTSGDGTANVILYIVVLALFAQVAVRTLRVTVRPRRFPVLALILTICVGIPSLLQFAVPALGEALRRDPQLTIHDGQWWRVLTSLLAQDGGLVAAIFNFVVIAGVVCVGEWIWGRWLALALFLVPSVVLNLLAIGWGASGGGSSFASDGLLMSVCGLALVTVTGVVVRACCAAAIAIGIVLAALDDAHGVAVLLGAALGVVVTLILRQRRIQLIGAERADA